MLRKTAALSNRGNYRPQRILIFAGYLPSKFADVVRYVFRLVVNPVFAGQARHALEIAEVASDDGRTYFQSDTSYQR